jgi:fructan beta-fructosidase
MTFDKRYLNLPVKTGGPKRRMSVRIDGSIVREFDIELADAKPDFWVFLDVSAFKGRKAVLHVDKLPAESGALKAVEQGDSIKGAEDLYRERLRPQFHFTSRRGWNNDTNGLVFHKGEYHLFYQHNPYGWNWGNMHWGHAVSTDLVNWEELPIAIYPRKYGDWVYSGSAVVDWKNTSSLKTGADDVLVAAYTSTGRGECIAYSNDRGRTWTDLAGNPVVKHVGRDPRLLWYEPGRHWVMAVYDEDPNETDKERKRCIAFYTSADLKRWEFASRTAGFFECPDLFELPADGNAADRRWVLTAASSEYMIGRFDGKAFTPQTPKLPGHRGDAFYAAQTFSDIPPADGRRIQMGWGRIATPGMPFNQLVTFPCELSLRSTPDGARLCWQPVKELQKLHAGSHSVKPRDLKPGENPLAGVTGELLDIRAEFEVGQAEEIGLTIRGTPVVYNAKNRTISYKDHKAPLGLADGKLRLQVLVDRTSFEIFANDGLVYMPMAVTSRPEDKSLETFTRGGAARIVRLDVHQLRSIWPQGR